MASGLKINVIGDGLPILLVHGWEMTGKAAQGDFEPVFGKIEGLRRLYVDLPGMGASHSQGVQSLDDIFHHLTRFVESELEGQRFLLAGSSCGAYLAHALAVKYADQVDGLLLHVPLVEPDNAKRDLDPCEVLVSNNELMTQMSIEDTALLGHVLVQTPEYIAALKKKCQDVYQPALEAADKEALQFIRSDPNRYRLSYPFSEQKFPAPALIVCGRHDDVVGYRDSRRLLELCPRSTYAVLDRGTHALPIDETALFEALINDWIKRAREWRQASVV
jgi:pimeloyl-ACP methyl ester carboxylesterase